MKKLIAAVALLLINNTYADVYPGDSTYSNYVQNIYHSVTGDNINLEYDSSITTRQQLCNRLVSRHNTGRNTASGQLQSNADFSGVVIFEQDCVNALTFTQGYSNAAGLEAWAGQHRGTWYDQSQTFSDSADWQHPVKEPSNDPSDLDNNGNPRVYDFQSVVFTERTGDARYGWNQSHPEVQYIWGWDPKDNSNDFGRTGTHVGFVFESGLAECIVWVTFKEAFLECVSTGGLDRYRTSTGFFGYGQWDVTNWNGGNKTNYVRSASVSASSTYPRYSVAKVKDGSRNTTVGSAYSWANNHPAGGSLPEWVRVDFGFARTINRVDLYTSKNYELKEFKIQYSSNGSSWTTVKTITRNISTHQTVQFNAFTARYFRIYATRGPDNQSIYARINELEAYYIPPRNLAPHAKASASSTYPGYSAKRANDGSTNRTVGGAHSWTNYHSAGGSLPEWLKLDFRKAINFSQVRLYTSNGYPIKDYKIQYSNNGVSWSTASTVTGNTSTIRTSNFSRKYARYIRINASKGPDNQSVYARINEIQVYNR